MKTIKIIDYQLIIPESSDYNHNSEFFDSFGKFHNLKKILFDVPEDAFNLSNRYWQLRLGTGVHFIEFNKILNGKFQTIILFENGFDIKLEYVSKNDRIIELLNEIKSYEGKISEIRREIEKLS